MIIFTFLKLLLNLLLVNVFVSGLNNQVPDFGPDFKPTTELNMNGEYHFTVTANGKPGLFPNNFKDYPGGVEAYDYYTPAITSYYSQVFWAPLDATPLPQAMVDKYAGKKAAIVGYEIDQVRKTPQGDVSVPITASYNHHYVTQITGVNTKFKKTKLSGPSDPRAMKIKSQNHGMNLDYNQEYWYPVAINESIGPCTLSYK